MVTLSSPASDSVESFGVFAPLALITLQALQMLVVPIPGQVLSVVLLGASALGYIYRGRLLSLLQNQEVGV